MSEQPKFLRDYSKQEHPEERNELAARIREARSERNEAPTLSESAESTVSALRETNTQIEELTSSGLDKVKDMLSWIGVKKRLATPETDHADVEIEIPPQFADPKKLLDDFYTSERARWAESSGTPEEMKELFSEKHLASLSMDEYALLLKRFPNAMVTHVTRQGIRDHTGMFEHTKGVGQYANGFMQILEAKELKSPLGVAAVEFGKEEAIARAIRLNGSGSQEEAEERLGETLSNSFDGYADRAAVHVATEEVADQYYGSERGNEIFIAFPSAHVAVEHNFIGNLAQGRDTKNNDTWIVQDTALDKGMDINAGVVFIPAEAHVDPVTGSRYALDDLKRPIENQQERERLTKLLRQEGIYRWAKEHKEAIPGEDMGTRFGITDPRLQEACARMANQIDLFGESYQNYSPEELERRTQVLVDGLLEQSGLRYKEAENAIPSEEFWSSYFTAHSDQKPSKVEFYRGDDPTAALLKWKQQHGLTRAGSEDSYNVGTGSRVTNVEDYTSSDKDRFRSIAEKLIQEKFS